MPDARQHAALATALLIGAQLLLGYWFYSYLTWFYPLLVIAVIRTRPEQEAAGASAHGAARPGEELTAENVLRPADVINGR